MQIVIFCHSLLSDWNHGNAHFLRGITTELISRRHQVRVYEPREAWSLQNLIAEHGENALTQFHSTYPQLNSIRYDLETLNLDTALAEADLVLVHEWNDHQLVQQIGKHRQHSDKYKLFFHDTHHRSATAPDSMAAYDLSNYDGVLAFGGVVRDIYLARGWAKQAWTWHEAADTRVFHPVNTQQEPEGDLVWIGNWGDEERTAELHEFLIQPVKKLGLKARIYGVRYPDSALQALKDAGIEYGGWLPNYKVPEVFSRFRVTVHVPRRPYAATLPGIPTIRPFEALACGIPLISAPWQDIEQLFNPGKDFLVAHTGEEMQHYLKEVLTTPTIAQELVTNGLHTIQSRHTCSHRVDELLNICSSLNL
ncbi:MAG: glycosyltransferase [Mojavia pulchra JT2-VF2]|jgi:spore maturation protein CgeB|uniref:Glycosyltransferase n=1 Tax=Mojavia pulchra JT2-VF2 TaxID=287848 RepID=A0A951PXV5_9NOST|nr:glycosyltransferase [Mojavia pulchra JT2-VF2]